MAKQRIQNYVFLPGVSKNSNAYPNAYALIDNNKEFIQTEAVAYINQQIALDNASNLYPNAVSLLTNNKQFIIDEIIAWIAYKVANNIAPFVGYSYNTASCRRDTGYLIDALIYDIRYGGNEKTIDIARNFWQGGTAQLISPTQEIEGFEQVFTIITDYILPKVAYSSQQSPVTSTQNVTGPAAEAGVATRITTELKPIIIDVIDGGLSVLPETVYSVKNYAGYIYDSSKCFRDIGLVIDAYLNDLRYGGNAKTRYIASRFWNGTTPQLSGDRKPEITAQTWIRDLINTVLLPQDNEYTPIQTAVTRYSNPAITYEPASVGRITTLSTQFINVLINGLSSLPELVPGVTTIRLQGKHDLDTLLLITNSTKNEVLYNFADPTLSVTLTTSTGYVSNDYWQDDDFTAFRNIADYVTEIVFAADTSTHSINDDIQIFVEAKEMRVRPYDFGTDAIERHRVAQAQSMLDADFEYGLQPTKWQAIGIARGYPSVYEVPGTDTPVINVVTDGSSGTGAIGAALLTVTTSGPHNFSVGQPFTIKSLANSITGFSRAEGTFIVNSVPTSNTFTYYAISKVGTNGQQLASTYTQLRKAAFYTGATIGTPTFAVNSNGVSGSVTTKWITPSGSDQLAFTGTAPSNGSPLSGTNIPTGAQVTGSVGPGGLAVTASVELPAGIGDTSIEVSDAAGILEGMAINNGTGTALFVSGISGNTINFTGPLATNRLGDTQTYLGISGTNLTSAGDGATFTITRVSGQYNSVSVTGAGTGYRVGDRIRISGTVLGGTTPANDVILTVTTLVGGGTSVTDPEAGIQNVSLVGTSVSGDATFANLTPDQTSGLGIDATFTVQRISGNYSVSVVNAGSGYQVGDTITIFGTRLEGTSPANDLVITVSTLLAPLNGVETFTISGTSVSSDATYTSLSGNVEAPAGTNATFNITRSGGSYTSVTVNNSGSNYLLGERIKIAGTLLGGASPTNDLTLIITSASSGQVSTVSSSGTAVTGESLEFWSSLSFSEATTGSIPDGSTITSSAIASVLVTFPSAHGLIPGASILVDINSNGSNHSLAKGPFYVESVPTATSLIYTARAPGTIDTATLISGSIYTRADSFFIHRPYDGGVQLGTGGPQHGAQAIRMSKKYIRYQSGKGINYCTGALFAPSFSIQSIIADGTAIGSYITITTDDIDHGCQVGGIVQISGIETKGYNNTYTVSDIINERTLRVQAVSVLANVTGTLTTNAQLSVKKWHGATVRAGTFDDQNGLFFQYDGQDFAVGRRSSTFQLAGTLNIARDSNIVTGTNTRFRDQVKAGDRIVIKGMTHVVTNVTSQTSLTVNPDYRGSTNAVSAKACLIQDLIIKQREFNIDRLDGTGPSGYNIDVTKMQMIGMQWSWYAVGFIDFMLRGSDGNFVFFHRIRNSNVNTEAYMRTGNNPVRYEVINEGARDKLLSSITSTQTTIPLVNASDFPNELGVVMIDNELITYSGVVNNTLVGCTRGSSLTNFVGGAQRTFAGGTASTHEFNTGVILVSNTISPIISHWGSAMLTDGNFDEDRGYIFNYAATNVSVSTSKQTAFLIRLAPSVSNAIIGDLGERELLNRAQLLLKGIEITADTGTGGIVIEGVLNPQNYPTDPGAITWTGLQAAAQGGQPSFAQIAPGGSVSWTGGTAQTTAPATTLAFPTGTITARAVSFRNNRSLNNGSSDFFITQTDYNTYIASGLAVGDRITGTGIQANTTITQIAFAFTDGTLGNLYRINLSRPISQNVNGDSSLTVTKAYQTASTSTIFFQKTSWESTGAVQGTEVSDVLFPAGAFVSTATLLTYFGTQYYRVTFTQTSSSSTTITPGTTTVTFKFGSAPYALPGETVFSFIASPGTSSSLDLAELKELTNTTLGGRGCYPNGPDVLAINVYKAAGTPIPANIVLRWGEAQA